MHVSRGKPQCQSSRYTNFGICQLKRSASRRSASPVSYTHLDVYKRQREGLTVAAPRTLLLFVTAEF